MRVMIVNGSPRRGGYTTDLIALFKAGVENAGGTVQVEHLREKKISLCSGCYHCWVGEGAGRCIHRDDMDRLSEAYLNSDAVVLASPLYFHTVSALLKSFLERLLPMTLPGMDAGGDKQDRTRHLRYPDRGPQKAVLIASCGLQSPHNLDTLATIYRLVCEEMCVQSVGELLRPESTLLDFEPAKPKNVRSVKAAFKKAGYELVQHGRVLPETEAEAVKPIIPDEDIFRNHLKHYWMIADELGSAVDCRNKVPKLAAQDPRILVVEMANCLNPQEAGDLKAAVQLNFPDSEHGQWYLQIHDGECDAVKGVHTSPDLSLTMSSETFADVAFLRMDARMALARGLIVAEGGRRLLASFFRLFRRGSIE